MQYKSRDKKWGFQTTEVFLLFEVKLLILDPTDLDNLKRTQKKKKVFSWDNSVSPIDAKNSFSFFFAFLL